MWKIFAFYYFTHYCIAIIFYHIQYNMRAKK